MKYLFTILLLSPLLNINAQDTISREVGSTDKIIIQNNFEIDSIFLEKLDRLHTDLDKVEESVSSKPNIKEYLPILVALLAGFLALLQVKANIISSARIEWTQNLRKLISQYISEIMILIYNLREVTRLYDIGKTEEAKVIYDNQTDSFKKVLDLGTEIKLFLNNKKESNHSDLQAYIEEYYEKATHSKTNSQLDQLDKLQDKIITKSQEILKQAWEDAKTFKIRDIFKIGW